MQGIHFSADKIYILLLGTHQNSTIYSLEVIQTTENRYSISYKPIFMSRISCCFLFIIVHRSRIVENNLHKSFQKAEMLNPLHIGSFLSHPDTFQVMQPQSWTYGVLYNLRIHDIKDKRVLDTLLFIQEGWNFKLR